MPFNRAELHFTEATLYREYEPEGENRILPFNLIVLQAEEEEDVVQISMSPYIKDYKGWGSSGQKWPMMLKRNNRVVKFVLSFL